MPRGLVRKLARLQTSLRRTGGLLIAFSGGTDSTFLLAAARAALGSRLLAVTAASPIHPSRETRAAAALARRLGVRHLVIRSRDLALPGFAANPPDRCYFCKQALFRRLLRIAARDGLPAVADGAHRDDRRDRRPGARAAAELGILSPLQDAGWSKAEIRRASRALGLPTADQPSAACLASRFPYGTRITPSGLRAVDRMETRLRRMGFAQVRARHHGAIVRLEVPPADLPRLCAPRLRRRIAKLAKQEGFVYSVADLEGYRTGSLDEPLARRAAGVAARRGRRGPPQPRRPRTRL